MHNVRSPRKYSKRAYIEPTKPLEFRKLQQEWYAKLDKKGFKDIEITNHRTGLEDINQFKVSLGVLKERLARDGGIGYELNFKFYSLLRNYLTHNPYWCTLYINEKRKRSHFIATKFSEGISYRTMIKQWVKRYPNEPKFSTMVIYDTVKRFVADALLWNKENAEGLEFEEMLDAESKGSV